MFGTQRRPAMTLPEMVLVLAICGIVLGIAAPRFREAVDRAAVHGATADLEMAFSTARQIALADHASVAVRIDSARGSVRVELEGRVVYERAPGVSHGVTLSPSRDSMAYDGRGLGRGGANLSIVVNRGAARDTVFISRLGRHR